MAVRGGTLRSVVRLLILVAAGLVVVPSPGLAQIAVDLMLDDLDPSARSAQRLSSRLFGLAKIVRDGNVQ